MSANGLHITNRTNAAKEEVNRALNTPADGMNIREAALVGSRLLTAFAILDGRMDIDNVTITLSHQAAPTPAKP